MSSMKKTILVAAVSAALSPLAAQAELSANIGVTSNYVWRGITQTDDGPAISGGLDWSDASGFYLGAWASNVDFVDEPVTDSTDTLIGFDDNPQYELDIYGGYAGEAGDFGYDLGFIHYAYPDADDFGGGEDELDFTELYLSGSYKWFSAGINFTVDKEADGSDDNDVYYYANASFELAPTWGLGGTIGHYDFDDSASEDYTHFQADLTKGAGDLGDFTLSLSTIDDDDAGDDDLIVFVSWGKSF